MTTTTREIIASTAPIIRLGDGSYRLVGPLPVAAADLKEISGTSRITDVTEVPFKVSLAGIAGLVGTPDPSLKGMTLAAMGAGTVISQCLPDGMPTAQYPYATLRAEVSSISFANADKLSVTAKLTGGVMTAAGFDFSSGNAIRDAVGVPQIQLHGCMYWHNGNPNGWTLTAANVKGQLDIINAAYKKNWDDKGYTASLKYMDVVNEIVDNAVQPSYVKNSPLTAAFRNSAEWKAEMEALNIPAITADPGAFGFLYALKKAAEVWGPGVELAIADYQWAEATVQYGYARNDDGFATAVHQGQRLERGYFNIRNALRAQRTYGGRLDNVNFQTHLQPGKIINPTDILWRNYEANMMGLGVMVGEMNLLLSSAETAAPFAAIGIAFGTPEEFIWNLNYVATHVALMRASCAKLKLIQPWTDKTDFGDGALTTFDKAGNFDVVGRGIQKAMALNIPKKAIRAGRTLFAKAQGFYPYELEGVVTGWGSNGIRGNNLKLPMTKYIRRDPTDGQLKDMSATAWESTFFMQVNGGVGNGRAWFLEDAAGNVVATIGFNAAGTRITLTTNTGVIDMGVSANGSYFRVGLQYKNGVLKACASRRSSAAGNPIETSEVFTQNVNLPAIAKIGMMVGVSASSAIEHRIYDETDLSQSDDEFKTRVTLNPTTGGCFSAQQIYTGAAAMSVAA